MTKNFLLILIQTTLLMNCALQKPVIVQKVAPISVPPGVDTLTVMIADSIFSQIAVTEDDKTRAMELFSDAQLINDIADSLWEASQDKFFDHQDSLSVLRQLEQAERYLRLDPDNLNLIKKMIKRSGRLNAAVLSHISKQLLLQSINFFEDALRKNRFDISYRLFFSQFLQKLSDRLGEKIYLMRAAEELERVVFVIKEHYQFYSELGDIYFKLNDWNNAYKNYELAKNTLRKTAIFYVRDPENYFARATEAPVDTTRLVNYLNRQAICKTRLYEAQPALALYREAKSITPNRSLKAVFEDKIRWILWDDGNIRASEIKDKGDTLAILNKDYVSAKNVYLELLPLLWTKRTKDEINWNIAQIDYTHLGNKAAGVERMFYVIKNSALDSLTGAPKDSSYRRYFNTYGKMCFNLGSDHLKKDKLLAYIYFTQAAETNYDERGKALLQLADISQFDANETIGLCNKTLEYLNQLDENEKGILYGLLYRAYRKLGDFTTARQWFERYKAF